MMNSTYNVKLDKGAEEIAERLARSILNAKYLRFNGKPTENFAAYDIFDDRL